MSQTAQMVTVVSEPAQTDAPDRVLQRLGLNQNPFSMAPDIVNFYSPARVEAVLVEILQLIETRMGFALLYGDVGLGKTTICRRILMELDRRDIDTSLVFNTSFQGAELLREINRDFGIAAPDASLQGQMSALNGFLLERRAKGKNCVIIIDDAQGLTVESLELVRQISNMETGVDKIVQIVLIGQPELEEKLNLYSLRQLKSRIVLKRGFRPYTRQETATYIRTKIARSGDRVRLEVTDSAARRVHEASEGSPRRINVIMGRCLYAAVAKNTHIVSREVAEAAIRDVEESLHACNRSRPKFLKHVAIAASLVMALPVAVLVMNYYGVVNIFSYPHAVEQFKALVMSTAAPTDPLPDGAERSVIELLPPPRLDLKTVMTNTGSVNTGPESAAVKDNPDTRPGRSDDVSDVERQAAVDSIPDVSERSLDGFPAPLADMAVEDQAAVSSSDEEGRRPVNGLPYQPIDSGLFVEEPPVDGSGPRPSLGKHSLHIDTPTMAPLRVSALGTRHPESVSVPEVSVDAASTAAEEDDIARLKRGQIVAAAADNSVASRIDEGIWGFLKAYELTDFAEQFETAARSYRFGSVFSQILEQRGLYLVMLPAIVADVKDNYTTLQIPDPENDSTNYLLFWKPREWPEENFSVFYSTQAVKRLQTALNRFGAYQYFIDGLPGRRTTAALELFQRAVGLPQSGAPDVETLFMLEFLNPHRRAKEQDTGGRGWTRMKQARRE